MGGSIFVCLSGRTPSVTNRATVRVGCSRRRLSALEVMLEETDTPRGPGEL